VFAARNRERRTARPIRHALIESSSTPWLRTISVRTGVRTGARTATCGDHAGVFQELLGETVRKAPSADAVGVRAHAETPLPTIARRSSRMASRGIVRQNAAVPMMTTRSQSAATSCRSCEENRMQRPSASRPAACPQAVNGHHVQSVGGSSRMRFPGHGPAPAQRHLDPLPCEKP